ncbi:glycosyltransferase, partial [Candidatus Pelagibacter sp.]|nr:glycosyltransferase [Candidatus Pelagibacter sp.]
KTVLEKNLGKWDKIVKLMFFDLNQNTNKKIKKYDFIYPADLKRHKNHKKVIMALLDLEKQNIKPSFLFTLTNEEKKKLKFDQLKKKINIYNFDKHNNRSSFLDSLKKTNCLFFPSHNETIGLPILEAFNQNLIIATANKTYAKQFVIPDFTFSPDSVHSIKQAIKKIYFIKKNNTTKTYKKSKKVKLSYFLQKDQFFKNIMK